MKTRSMKAFLPLGIFAILIIGFYVGTRLNPQQLSSELIGEPVPAFELPSLYEDQPAVTQDVLKGKITLLNVFGSWCITCVVEHPYLMELKRTEDIQMLGIDWRDTREAGQDWLAKRGRIGMGGIDTRRLIGADALDGGIGKSSSIPKVLNIPATTHSRFAMSHSRVSQSNIYSIH